MDDGSGKRIDIRYHGESVFMPLHATLVTAFVTVEECAAQWKQAVSRAFVAGGWTEDTYATVFVATYEGPVATRDIYDVLVGTVVQDIQGAIDQASSEIGECLCADVNFQVGNFGSYTVHACDESSDWGMTQEILCNFYRED